MPYFSILSKMIQAMNNPDILQIWDPYHWPHADILQNYLGAPISRHKEVFWCQSAAHGGWHRLRSRAIKTAFFCLCAGPVAVLRKL